MAGNTAGEWVSVSLVTLMAAAPLVAVTVFSHRSRRQGWWLAAPWILLAAIWLLLLQVFYSLHLTNDLVAAAFATGVVAGWLSLSIFLIALTIAGPKVAPPGVGRRS